MESKALNPLVSHQENYVSLLEVTSLCFQITDHFLKQHCLYYLIKLQLPIVEHIYCISVTVSNALFTLSIFSILTVLSANNYYSHFIAEQTQKLSALPTVKQPMAEPVLGFSQLRLHL